MPQNQTWFSGIFDIATVWATNADNSDSSDMGDTPQKPKKVTTAKVLKIKATIVANLVIVKGNT